ncbi:MAG: hypothetical protein JOZ29_20730 [Deltaproteobacteria bacterium]|nr:hypothetical protein [Deltaproteobacteria bacterium]
MKAKIFRILGIIGFILAIGSLSACFEESYHPAYPGYAYGSPAYAYPHYAPRYVPTPRYYASDPHPYWRHQHGGEHEHGEHEWHEHHYNHG